MENEIWKDIPNYEGYYQVSNMGNVRSLDRENLRRDKWGNISKFRRKGSTIKNKLNNYNKYFVSLSKNGIKQEYHVARLVLKSFTGPPNENEECCHKNDIQTDDRLDNLYWGTREDNIKDKFINGKIVRGSLVGTSKLKKGEVWLIKKLLKSKIRKSVISKMFNVTRQLIRHIEKENVWKHIKLNEEVLV